MDQEKIKILLEKYSIGECSVQEQKLIEDWYCQLSEQEEENFIDPNYESYSPIVWSKIDEQIKNKKRMRQKKQFSPFIISVAASLILAISIFTYWQLKKTDATLFAIQNEIIPGDNRASLYLSDGTTVHLDQIDEEWNTDDLGVRIKKLEGGFIAYEVLEDHSASSIGKYHTIKTPKGGQYQILLPDGTKVWLNANSSLRYPIKFDKIIREVELTGEAYFEVNKQKSNASQQSTPFYVHSQDQRVEVLGTHFNVSAYEEEIQVKTTLLEGSVRVVPVHQSDSKSSLVLDQTGQQAILENNNIQLARVNVEHIIDWKNGYFVFNNEDLYSILRKVARWYDLDIEFSSQAPILALDGAISKYENIESVLSVIEFASGVKLKLKGRRIIVMP